MLIKIGISERYIDSPAQRSTCQKFLVKLSALVFCTKKCGTQKFRENNRPDNFYNLRNDFDWHVLAEISTQISQSVLKRSIPSSGVPQGSNLGRTIKIRVHFGSVIPILPCYRKYQLIIRGVQFRYLKVLICIQYYFDNRIYPTGMSYTELVQLYNCEAWDAFVLCKYIYLYKLLNDFVDDPKFLALVPFTVPVSWEYNSTIKSPL